ncbi:2-keto-4-pentenoate hydratase/2-oxohepta-3-ene-1,7-dioic acid hydratase (catechol pathway) [Xaviernesmea oryzae]|uniref:2-keto-4-pentenoate hydratase/2-oxohepta-3-ene-1,7-dioic acid hydratase (Catechol pathway) n=1 Tax=Xaviernesmea oryzae TaxID=464029 RepID=A0A1X7FXG0_9HYPH|nr:fumarylacetoacetate hydrolase family protein [Xaviernesmea oryzae]SMF59830.1 2-keto-4-pentenoate hydratase/2-oxohepta-3-ene-1,7-dioic acid hydratase (catechol pathway) [Xaviernesmea oryzae]
MKFVRFGEPGQERPGMIDASGTIRDLSTVIDDISGRHLSKASVQKLSALNPQSLPAVTGDTRIGPCVGDVRNFISIGLNYVDHAIESNAPIPPEPIVFNKLTSCISGPNDPVVLMKDSKKTDWEVEVAMVIGEPTYLVDEQQALSSIAGLCICHDISEREFQLERGGQWMKGKSGPTYGPLGPWLVTPDELDIQNLDLWLDVNSERMQTGTTAKMIFGFATIVSYLSQFMKLMPGDVITTGTPPGVGMAMTPPRFLQAGDVVSLGVAGLGEQRQDIVAHRAV